MVVRKLLLFAAVLVALGILAANINPTTQPAVSHPKQVSHTVSSTPQVGNTKYQGATVSAQLSAAPNAFPVTIPAHVNDVVNLTVTGNQIDTITIPALDLIAPLDPIAPAQINVYCDTVGTFSIVDQYYNRVIGYLQVTPDP
jgi:hypothetical protein